MERSTIIVKPDGVQRGLIGEIIHRFERKGLKLVGLKMMALDDVLLDQWYAHHKDKPFFPGLKAYMQSYPVIAMCWLSLIHISEPTRRTPISYAVFCLQK